MTNYFYIDTLGQQRGPFSIEKLSHEPIRNETLVWTEGMAEWQPAYDVVDLRSLFDPTVSHPFEYSAQKQSQESLHNVPVMPKTWMMESILVTILPFVFCGNIFSLIGIAAIVNASKVESMFNSGLYAKAKEASDNAGRWTKITFWIAIGGIVLAIIAVILFIIFFGSLAGLSSMADW